MPIGGERMSNTTTTTTTTTIVINGGGGGGSVSGYNHRRIIISLLLLLIPIDGAIFGTTTSALTSPYRQQQQQRQNQLIDDDDDVSNLHCHHPSPSFSNRLPSSSCTSPSTFGILHHCQSQSQPQQSFLKLRGGDSSTSSGVTETEEEVSLEDKVAAAMARLGLTPDGLEEKEETKKEGEGEKDEGSSPIPPPPPPESSSSGDVTPPSPPIEEEAEETEEAEEAEEAEEKEEEEDIDVTIERIAKDMDADTSIVIAALGATREVNQKKINEKAAREMIQMELDAISSVPEDCEEAQTLISEGHSPHLVRRALSFSSSPSPSPSSPPTFSLPTARAILQADEEDARLEEEERLAAEAKSEALAKRQREAREKKEMEDSMTTVKVDGGFDPTQPAVGAAAVAPPSPSPPPPPAGGAPPSPPPRAQESEVIFTATSSTIFSLVLDSPVPVLLDVYADWCGPCKALTPALAEMAVKGGGLFRLVKLDTDAERELSGALGVRSLPTVFAVRDGRIVGSFEGMPRDQTMVQSFMMGLMTGEFEGQSEEEKEKYDELSKKFARVASSAGFSFEDREKLTEKVSKRLSGMNPSDAARAAKLLRSLLSNVIQNPYELKYRRINLENRVLASAVRPFPPAVSILKECGFVREEGMPRGILLLGGASGSGGGKKVVNVTPLTVARDGIDKWILRNAREIAAEERRKRDEEERETLLAEAEEVDSDEEEEEEEEEEVDPDACRLKVRIEGKNKIHDVEMRAGDTLASVLERVVPDWNTNGEGVEEYRITCTAKRLVVSSLEQESMEKSLAEHRLVPSASIVIKAVAPTSSSEEENEEESTSIQERAAARLEKTKGRPRENTMQSVGIYSKDDNAKGELIDGGGGVWYEQDVSSDDEGDGNGDGDGDGEGDVDGDGDGDGEGEEEEEVEEGDER